MPSLSIEDVQSLSEGDVGSGISDGISELPVAVQAEVAKQAEGDARGKLNNSEAISSAFPHNYCCKRSESSSSAD